MRGGVIRKSLGSMIIVVVDAEAELKPGMVEELAKFKTWDSVKNFRSLGDVSREAWPSLEDVLKDIVDSVSACGGQHRQAAIRLLLSELEEKFDNALEELRRAALEYDTHRTKNPRKDRTVYDPVREGLKAALDAAMIRAGDMKATLEESGWWMISVYDRSE